MKILDNLKFLGYDVEVKENNIRLSYIGEGKPDKNRVLPLLEELKVKKYEVIKELQKDMFLSDETLQDLYLKTMHKINDSYIEGTIKYIQEQHKELDTKIDEVDEQINDIWESCLQGKAGLSDFKDALDSYQNLYLEGISLYKSKIEQVKQL